MFRCDVLAVGTELLLGDVVDTNSAFIGRELRAAGIASQRHVHVGDNVTRIAAALGALLDEADAVIVCGGLGPTHDDLTRDAIAAVAGVPLDHDDAIAAGIAAFFAGRGRTMAANNLRQAQVPRGAAAIANPVGTAPGLMVPVRRGGADRVVYAVPGVPREMQPMMSTVVADLRRRAGVERVIVSRTLKTWGESESRLNERLDAVIAELDRTEGTTLAFLASGWNGMKVRLTASAGDVATANDRLDEWEARVRAEVGELIYAVDEETMESVVLDLCRRRGWTLGCAESLTGGLVAARLTEVPGASDTFRGAVVSYASDVKFDLLGVTPGPVVSEQAATQMAAGARRVLGVDCAVALTGVAGPSEQEDQPVGTVCLAAVTPAGQIASTLHLGRGGRAQIREMAVINALHLLRGLLLH